MKKKKTADVSVRIYKDSRRKLKMMAAKLGLSLAGTVERLLNQF